VLCLGAGGAGTAITVHLLTEQHPRDRPGRILVVDEDQDQLDRLHSIADQIESRVEVDYRRHATPELNDRILAGLPAGSIVINATGRGKDRPGSPITDQGIFPRNSIVWELNYRGELEFLRQARAQAVAGQLRVQDGWDYLVGSWASHVAEIFGLTISPVQFGQLLAQAEQVRATRRT